jgi:hypothetical protein
VRPRDRNHWVRSCCGRSGSNYESVRMLHSSCRAENRG